MMLFIEQKVKSKKKINPIFHRYLHITTIGMPCRTFKFDIAVEL